MQSAPGSPAFVFVFVFRSNLRSFFIVVRLIFRFFATSSNILKSATSLSQCHVAGNRVIFEPIQAGVNWQPEGCPEQGENLDSYEFSVTGVTSVKVGDLAVKNQ